jgi:hypothetical protein
MLATISPPLAHTPFVLSSVAKQRVSKHQRRGWPFDTPRKRGYSGRTDPGVRFLVLNPKHRLAAGAQ